MNQGTHTNTNVTTDKDDRPRLAIGLGGNPNCPRPELIELGTGESPQSARKYAGLVAPSTH